MQKFWLLYFWLLCFAISSQAQVFPIQSQVNLIPPYSGNLSDYTVPGAHRISITIRSNDASLIDYRVKLRLTIDGVGVTVRSKPNVVYQPITIDGGSPLILYGDDLIEYLDPKNLDFIGFSRSEYQRTGKIPEGVYRFSVEVLDYNRGTVVSNKGFTTAWILFNDAPILNLPNNASKVRITDPTNIPFSWTPRHLSSPNSAFTSEYVFRLIEIWPNNRNPNDAFLTQTPLYEVETRQSQIVYGADAPLLIPGRKYAWQVQARDTEGRDLFRNNGKSEVFAFQFGDAIEMPQNVRKEFANATTISMRWEASTVGEIPERFRVRYRPVGGTMWYEDVTTNYYHTLGSLRNNTSYDIQVRSESGRQVSDYTFSQRHSTTLPMADTTYQCGSPYVNQLPQMTTPLQYLNPGDIFKSHHFNHVLVTEATTTGTQGGFSGTGYMRVKALNSANIAVSFSGTLNAEYVLVTGSVKTITDVNNNMSKVIEEMKKIGENKPVLDSVQLLANSNFIIISGIVDSVYVNSEGKIVVIDEGGAAQTFEQKTNNTTGEKQEMIVKDAAGNTWTVNKDGTISKAEAAIAGTYSSRDSLNFVVTFRENESGHYGFDPDDAFPTPTNSTINNRNYKIAWKAVEQGKQDFVDAIAEGPDNFPRKVGLKLEAQTVATQPGTQPNAAKVVFPGGFEGDTQELTAYAKLKENGSSQETEVVLGKLKIATYEYIQKKLVVVPVNTEPMLTGPEITSKLNAIYGQAVAGWQVTIANRFNIAESFIDKLDEEESGNLASYNKKMREFNREYKNSNPAYDKTAFYIFLIKGENFRFDAFMPFKRGFGYVFFQKLSPSNNETIIRTIAHELGHGAFNLRHTFDQFSVTEGSTQNLMDYNGGDELRKYQWDYVHHPESMIGWLQDDEEGAIYDCPMWFSGECEEVGEVLELIKHQAWIGGTITTKKPANINRRVLTASNIELDEVNYADIRIVNLVDTIYRNYDARDFEEYSQTMLNADGKTEQQRGFVYRTKPTTKLAGGFLERVYPIAVKILLYEDEEDFNEKYQALKAFLFGDIPSALAYEIDRAFTLAEMTPVQIQYIRKRISRVRDSELQKQYYLTLQAKVPYHNQRDNTSIATDEDVENNSSWLSAGETIGDIMCNLTSQAMCFEYLGLTCPDPNMQFEDYLEELRRDEGFDHRGTAESRKNLASEIGVKYKLIELNTDDKEILKTKLKPELEAGRAVLISAFSAPKGHIVRLQAITTDGLVVDDPYGQVQNFIERETGGFGYTNGKNSTNDSNILGKDNLWTWSNIKDTIIKIAEIYYTD